MHKATLTRLQPPKCLPLQITGPYNSKPLGYVHVGIPRKGKLPLQSAFLIFQLYAPTYYLPDKEISTSPTIFLPSAMHPMIRLCNRMFALPAYKPLRPPDFHSAETPRQNFTWPAVPSSKGNDFPAPPMATCPGTGGFVLPHAARTRACTLTRNHANAYRIIACRVPRDWLKPQKKRYT